MATAVPKTKAADLLLRAQVLTREAYDRVLGYLQTTNDRAEDVLIDYEILSEADVLKALAAIYRTNFVSTEKLAKADIPKATVQLVPRRVAETLGVFPVVFDRQSGVLSVVTADPDNLEVLREVKLVSGAREMKAFVARPAAITAAIRKHHIGDVRAFERFEHVSPYAFGQQVLPDGRVMAARDTFKQTNGDDEMAFERNSTTATRRQTLVDDEFTRGGGGRSDGNARPASAPDFDGSMPSPVPRRPAKQDLTIPTPPAMMPITPRGRPTTQRFDPLDLEPATEPAPIPVPPAPTPLFENDATVDLLTVMVSLLESSRQELRGHSSQVARLLRRVAERMNLGGDDTRAVVLAGHIHDLGKMGQFHLTALNCSEYEGHRTAAQKSYDTPLRLLEAVRVPPPVKNAVFHMYERFDGKGFPDKLVGKDIPLGARLLAVADTYADLTQSARNPFRKVLGPAEAMDALCKYKATIFDPGIVDLFKALVLGEDMKAKLLANRHRVLLVDPDPEESTVLELRMLEQGFDVKLARTAEAARKLASAEGAEFDLVVSELDLPDGDGFAFLSDARKEPWGRDLPWIVHTHKQGRAEAQRAFDLGAKDFVVKPVQGDVFVAKIKSMLDQQSETGTSRAAGGVSGSLREMGLPDIVQVLFHGRKTGKLNVKSGGKAGEIHFLEGAVANAIFGTVSGAPAFYAMVRFTEGEFSLDPSFVPPKRLLNESAEALLLEGMRRMDEGI